jgi:hypothetical protein
MSKGKNVDLDKRWNSNNANGSIVKYDKLLNYICHYMKGFNIFRVDLLLHLFTVQMFTIVQILTLNRAAIKTNIAVRLEVIYDFSGDQ